MKRITALILLTVIFLTAAPGNLVIKSDAAEVSSAYPNIAIGKETVYNSISNTATGYEPWNINDGNYNTPYSDANNIILPSIDGMKYVGVDLGMEYNIDTIAIYPRFDIDQSGSRLGWQVFGANKADYSDKVKLGTKTDAGNHMEPYVLKFDDMPSYRYILLMKSSFFVISDMEIYGASESVEVNTTFSDTEGLENEINLFAGIGILKPAEEGVYGSNRLVTRGEAAEYVVKAGNLNASGAAVNQYYLDVPPDHEYAKYIGICREMNIISADDYFRPDDYVTPTELAKMLLMVMNYGTQLQFEGNYPSNIHKIASKLDLFDGIRCETHESLDKFSMTKMVYNALLANVWAATGANEEAIIFEQGNTMLQEFFGIQLMRGVVTGTSNTKLLTENQARDKRKIEIDNIEYRMSASAANLDECIGHCVYFARDSKMESVLFGWIAADRENVVTVYGDEVKSTSKTEIVVYKGNDKETRYTLNPDKYVIRNGVAYGGFSDSALVPSYGYCELVDFDDDKKYDVIMMHDPLVFAVSYVNVTDSRVLVGGFNGEKIESDEFDKLEISVDGASFEGIMIPKNSVVFAYVSENKRLITLDCYSKTVSGTVVSRKNTDSVVVDGVEYEFSTYFKDTGDFSEFNPGKDVNFVVRNNEILYKHDIDFMESIEYLGCIVNAVYLEKGIKGEIRFKIYNHNNEHKVLTVADRLTLDGETKSRSEIAGIIQSNSGYFRNKFLEYRLNSKGEIIYMDTENFIQAKEPDSIMQKSSKTVGGSGAYFSNSGFSSGLDLVLVADGSEMMFTLACDTDGNLLAGEEFEQYYSVATVNSTVAKNTEMSGNTYTVYGYDAEKGTGEFLVRINTYETSVTDINPIETNGGAQLMLVNNILTAMNKDGELHYGVEGYVLGSPSPKISEAYTTPTLKRAVETSRMIKDLVTDTYYGKEFTYMGYVQPNGVGNYSKSIEDIQKGDIIRYRNDSNGNLAQLELIYSPNDPNYNFEGRLVDSGNLYHKFVASFRTRKGKIKSVKDGIIVIDTGSGAEDRFIYSALSGTFVVVEDDFIEIRSASEMPAVCEVGEDVVVSSAGGSYVNLVLYKQ